MTPRRWLQGLVEPELRELRDRLVLSEQANQSLRKRVSEVCDVNRSLVEQLEIAKDLLAQHHLSETFWGLWRTLAEIHAAPEAER